MLEDRDNEIVIHIIDHCNRIVDNIKKYDLDSFYKDRNIQDIVLFNFFQIGELTKCLSNTFTNSYNKMPWKEIKGMRDVIVHGYQTINLERTYNTAIIDVVDLLNYCVDIVKNNGK